VVGPSQGGGKEREVMPYEEAEEEVDPSGIQKFNILL